MRAQLGFAILFFFACSSSSSTTTTSGSSTHDAGAGDAAHHPVEAGAEAEAASNAPPLDCSQDDANWPTYNHDVCNSRAPSTAGGISTQTVAKLAVKWTYAAAGEVTMTPAVVGNAVYVGDWGGTFARLDAATGQPVWSKSVAELAGWGPTGDAGDAGGPPDPVLVRATPLVTSSAVVFGITRDGFSSTQSLAYLIAVDPNTGALLWKTLLDDHPAAVMTGSPVLEGNRIFVGVSSLEEAITLLNPSAKCCTFRGSVVALDAATGQMVWKTPMIDDATYFQSDGKTPAGYAGAAVWSGVPTVDRHRQRLYITTGNNYAMPSGVSTPPAGDHVESIVALDMASGAIVWARSMTTGDVWTFTEQSGPDYDFGCGANLFQGSVGGVTRDLVGAGQKSGTYWALDPDTGDTVWKTKVGPGGHLGGIHWGTAYDGARLYLGVNDNDGSSYALQGSGSQSGQSATTGSWGALDPTSGDVLWQIADPALPKPLNGASVNGPVTVVGGVMFAGSMDAQGTMYALDAKSGAVLWSFAAGGTVYGGPAVSGGVVYWGAGYPLGRLGFGSSAKKLYAFAPE
jgi:polyvinyl alcohol dehydrogenase (cytochrome)